jgi:ClpP class serine protease
MSLRRRTVGLSDILTSKWLIEKRYAQGFFPTVLKMLNAETPAESTEEKRDASKAPYNFSTGETNSINVFPISEYAESTPPEDAPANSVAIVDLKGPITKYDQWCGGAGTETKTNILQRCFANPNIVAIVLDVDSGGGEGGATEAFSEEIHNAPKPVLASVNGMACSAAYRIASSCREIFMSGKTSEVGSIGSYVEVVDFTKYYEEMGVEIIRVYAPQSTLKNKAYEDLLKGDDSAMKADLKTYTDYFIGAVKENRQAIKDDKKVFKGECYYTEDAIAIGLADQQGTLLDCVLRAYELSDANPNAKPAVVEIEDTTDPAQPAPAAQNTQSKSKNTMFGNPFPQMSALKNVKAEELTEETLNKVNAELTLKGITAVTAVSTAELENVMTENTTLSNKVETLTTEHTEAIRVLTEERDALKTKITELESEDGAAAVDPAKKEDKHASTEKKVEDLPHMKQAANFTGKQMTATQQS